METTRTTVSSVSQDMEFTPITSEELVNTNDDWVKESAAILGKRFPTTQGKVMEYKGELREELDTILVRFNQAISKHADELISLNAFGYSMTPNEYVNWVEKKANGYTLEELRQGNKQLDTMCQFEDIKEALQEMTDFENRNRHVVKEYLGIAG